MEQIKVPMNGYPTEKQQLFLKSTKPRVGYGGARGGGKSWAIRAKAKLLAFNYQGIKILIIRRSYPELVNNHITQLRKELLGIATYRDKDKILEFPNGSTIKFMYCANDSDLLNFQGAEFDVIFIDEATQLTEKMMTEIEACCRGVNDFPKRIYYTCNPGGVGHEYIKRVFVDRRFKDEENPDDYEFVQALVTDNEPLMKSNPDYIKNLEKLPPKRREAWLHGKWDIFEGQFFEEFTDDQKHYKDRVYTHVIEPFDIPKGWNIYRSYDWGYAKPFSCGWWAIDYDGVLYRILEYYGCTGEPNEGVKMTPDQQFKEIKRIESEHPYLKGRTINGYADPACWNKETGESVMDTAAKYGIYFSKGDNKRIAGWMQVHYRMQFDDNGYPMMYVFNHCKHFIRTIPLLTYSETKVEDVDTTQEDHIADETRYMCMSRPIKPIETKQPAIPQDDPLNMISKGDRYGII